jgi:hypothetical protein
MVAAAEGGSVHLTEQLEWSFLATAQPTETSAVASESLGHRGLRSLR